MTGERPLRVVQWATGNVGRAALRAIAARPDLELVGVFVSSPDKDGRDAGELAGTGPLGVAATADRDTVLALGADVVVHTPLPSLVHGDEPGRDVDDFCHLLAAGSNVITTVGYMYPAAHGPELVGRLETAAAEGAASFHGTGANPGWFGDVLPLLMSGLMLRVERVRVREISSFQRYPSPEIMFDMMGFGATPAEFERRAERHRRWLDGLFTEAVMMVAHGLGAEVDDVTSAMEVDLAGRDLETAAGTVGRGTVAGQRWEWAAISAAARSSSRRRCGGCTTMWRPGGRPATGRWPSTGSRRCACRCPTVGTETCWRAPPPTPSTPSPPSSPPRRASPRSSTCP